jgi:hypothetical protein
MVGVFVTASAKAYTLIDPERLNGVPYTTVAAVGCKSNSSRWSKFDPLYKAIGSGVKIFSSPKHNLLQQFPYSPSQLVGPTMPRHPFFPSPKSSIFLFAPHAHNELRHGGQGEDHGARDPAVMLRYEQAGAKATHLSDVSVR